MDLFTSRRLALGAPGRGGSMGDGAMPGQVGNQTYRASALAVWQLDDRHPVGELKLPSGS